MRRWLVIFLAAAAAVLSFDALRAHALESGVIPTQAIMPRTWLAALWATVIDAAAAAGILGVRADRRDPRAWLMLTLAFAASVGFQVWTPPTPLARAVPPVVLALAIIVLELPRRAAVTVREPVAAVPVRVAEVSPPKPPPRATPPAPRTTHPARAQVAALVERTPDATITQAVGETGLSRTRAAELLREEKQRRNGHAEHTEVQV